MLFKRNGVFVNLLCDVNIAAVSKSS